MRVHAGCTEKAKNGQEWNQDQAKPNKGNKDNNGDIDRRLSR